MSKEKNKYVVLVDNENNEIGTAEKLAAHTQGLLHRAFSVVLLRKRGDTVEFLLQQREQAKYHSGGLWTNACCSHPTQGENIIDAARRRLKEEMNIETKLYYIDSFIYKAEVSNNLIEHELDHVVVGFFEQDNIELNKQEAQDYKWISLEQLKQEMILTKDKFTFWLPKVMSIVFDNMSVIMRLLVENTEVEQTS